MKHFTVHADEGIDARIRADLETIRAALLADVPQLVGLVLVGAFGRGEGSVISDARGVRPYNDYDLVLVHPPAVAVPDLTPRRRALARALGVTHVDVEVLTEDELAHLPPSMHAHDLKHGGFVLHGDPGLLARIPDIGGDAVGAGPARLLLFNRLTCLLESVTAADFARAPEGEARLWMAYMTHKVMLTVAAAMLARAGAYHHSYRERLARFATSFPGRRDMLRQLEASTRFKLDPAGEVADPRPAWFRVRNWYLELVRQAAGEALGGPFESWDDLARGYRGDRARDLLRKAKWWVLDRRKYEDIAHGQRRRDIELAEIYLTAAVRPDGGFDAALTGSGRALLAPHTRARLADWDACRAEAVRLDLAHVHPT